MLRLDQSRILITKDKLEAESAFAILQPKCKEIIYFPTIKIKHIESSQNIIDMISSISKYEYIIFTSMHSVIIFNDLLIKNSINFPSCKYLVVGAATAKKCKNLNIPIEFIPNEFSAKGLLNEFGSLELTGKEILIPGSSLSRSELKIGLEQLGAKVTHVSIYDVVSNEDAIDEVNKIKKSPPDIFAFTSPSSFINFIKLFNVTNPKEYFSEKLICAIGKTTELAIYELGLDVNLVPKEFSLQGLSNIINEFFEFKKDLA